MLSLLALHNACLALHGETDIYKKIHKKGRTLRPCHNPSRDGLHLHTVHTSLCHRRYVLSRSAISEQIITRLVTRLPFMSSSMVRATVRLWS